MIKITTHIILFLSLFLSAIGPAWADGPKREFRGVWVATVWGIDWPSKQGSSQAVQRQQKKELDDLLDRCRDLNMTSVFFQVRSMGDVMYQSSLEPWSAFVSGKRGESPGWDPLAYVVEACHDRGLECYAWVNPFRWSSGTDYNTVPDKRWKQSGWLLTHGKYTVFNPGLEAVREHIVEICREIVEGYRIDGLVFDDYFYPNKIPENSSAPDYELYKSTAPWMDFGDWRRANVHKTVADVYAMINDTRPGVKFGISPAGVAGKSDTSAKKWGMEKCDVKAADWQYREIYSDPLGWLYQHTVDFISPQIYWPTTHATAPYEPLSRWWSDAANLYGRHFYGSVTMESFAKNDTPENHRQLLTQIATNRLSSIDGNLGTVIYSAKFLPKISDELIDGHFATPSVTPAMTWKSTPELPGVTGLKKHGSRLEWNEATLGNEVLRYTVYAIPASVPYDDAMADDGDGISGDYLLGVSYLPRYEVPEGKYRYAVCVLDGASCESEPVYIK